MVVFVSLCHQRPRKVYINAHGCKQLAFLYVLHLLFVFFGLCVFFIAGGKSSRQTSPYLAACSKPVFTLQFKKIRTRSDGFKARIHHPRPPEEKLYLCMTVHACHSERFPPVFASSRLKSVNSNGVFYTAKYKMPCCGSGV